jgi:methylthioribulose-1-phosphate dehydratase
MMEIGCAVAPGRRLDVALDSRKTERTLAEMGRRFHARGWALGTSGNFSAVVSRRPFRLAITGSGHDKRTLRPAHIVTVDAAGKRIGRGGRPSAETLLHLTIARARGAGAVMHTHSVWNTMLSDWHGDAGGLHVEGYEMLKGLDGVTSHEHREWIPILENDQDMPRLAAVLEKTLAAKPETHAVLLRRHGLYTWGETLAAAERHVEILEFLLETLARRARYDEERSHGGTPWRS